MNFGEKIKKIRIDNNLSQEELADKLFVTRTAISKWETGKGYPSIDSFKLISNLFGVSIDDLISDDDIECKKVIDEKRARDFYWVAVAFLSLTVLSALLAFLIHIPYMMVVSLIGTIGYVSCAFFAKPKYKRLEAKKYILTYIVSRVVVLVIVIIAVIVTIRSL